MKAGGLRVLATGVFAALAIVVAGCGGASKAGSSTSAGASMVRSGAFAYVAVDSDTGSSQWKQLDSLLQKFPAHDLAIAGLKAELSRQGVDWDNDVKPALGPEVDIAAVGTSQSNASFAFLTQPKDEGKFKDLVAKLNAKSSGSKAVYRKVGDWYALSRSQAMIDRVLAPSGAKTLADDSAFKDAFAKLPGEALVKAYLSPKPLASLLQSSQQGASPYGAAAPALAKLDSLSASLSAENDGVRLHGATIGQSPAGSSYTSQLLTQAPGDALAFLTFRGGNQNSKTLGLFNSALHSKLGITGAQIAALFANETGLWIRPGALIPEVTAILQPNHTAAGLATLDKLASALAATAGATFHKGAQRTLEFKQFAVHYGAVGGKIVITNAAGGVSAAGGSGDKLPASADFSEAKSAAGLPDSTGGFIYIDLKNAIPLIEGFAGLSGSSLSPMMTQNLRPLRSFLAWGAGSGDTQSFDAFLEIK